MTFPSEDKEAGQEGSALLDPGLRSPGWLVAMVAIAAVCLVTPAFSLNEVSTSRAATLAISVYFLVSGFIAFNYPPERARIFGVLTWAALATGLWLGNHDGQWGSCFIVGVAGLAGVEALSRACHSLRSLANIDPLTGLQNRTGLVTESGRAITICRRLDQPLSLAHIDLDGFKEINDTAGHAEGDRILRECADRWKGVIRSGDILARIGGDEFLLVLPGSNSEDARRLMGVLKEVSPVDWSFGVAELAPGEELQACVDRADAELYTQKAARERPQ